jgi:Transposase DDE domain/DDE_Tnp_1-associated
MLTAVVCGLLCGNRGYTQLVEWLHDLPVAVWHWMGYTRRPPKLDCFRDLLMKLDPPLLESLLSTWIHEALGLELNAQQLQAVSLDGKTLCGTLRPFARAVHLLAAVDHQTGCVLSQCRVDEKTNEHKSALELLQTLVLEGRVIVGDAIFCQREVCQQIIDSGGHYFLAVKGNQAGLEREISLELSAPDGVFSPLHPAPAALGA